MKTKLNLNGLIPVIILIVVIVGCTQEEIIKVDVNPQLEIKVIDSSNNIVDDATATLFATEEDWESKSKAIYKKSTNAQGKVLFSELNEVKYYFFIEKGDQNNYYEIATFSNPLRKNEIKTISCTIK